MYLILDSVGRIVDISEEARYVKRQKNGLVVGCAKENAEAIYSANADKFFPLKPIGYTEDSHTLVEVKEVPNNVTAGYYFYHDGDFYTTEAELKKLAQAKAESDLVPLASIMFVQMANEGKFDDTTIVEHAAQFPDWTYPVSYAEGNIVRKDGKLYRCLQAHTSQADWSPEKSASLWKEVGDPGVEYPVWSQPIGAADAYSVEDKVTHNGKRWVSTCDNNVWEPGVYGWAEVKS